MHRISTHGRRLLAAGAALVCLMGLASPAAYAAQTGAITLTVKQVFPNTGPSAFSYSFAPALASNPMPNATDGGVGSGADGYAFTITGTGEHNIGPIAFTQAGIYAYTLRRVTACACPNQAYALKVYVENDLTISVVVNNPDGTKAMGLLFEHTCGTPAATIVPGTTAPATRPPDGKPGPVTGDDSQFALYMTLFCSAAAALLGLAVYLLVSKRRRQTK